MNHVEWVLSYKNVKKCTALRNKKIINIKLWKITV